MESNVTGFCPFTVIFTAFKWVFIDMSTPVCGEDEGFSKKKKKWRHYTWHVPPTVPWTIVPFFNSIVTVSLLSFIKNLCEKKMFEVVDDVNFFVHVLAALFARQSERERVKNGMKKKLNEWMKNHKKKCIHIIFSHYIPDQLHVWPLIILQFLFVWLKKLSQHGQNEYGRKEMRWGFVSYSKGTICIDMGWIFW